MKKYQQLAQQIIEQINLGVWQPGDRLPSLREQVTISHVSFMTVSHAYQMLESQGRIVARPQSGYYVASPPSRKPPMPPARCCPLARRFPIRVCFHSSSLTAPWLTSAKPPTP